MPESNQHPSPLMLVAAVRAGIAIDPDEPTDVMVTLERNAVAALDSLFEQLEAYREALEEIAGEKDEPLASAAWYCARAIEALDSSPATNSEADGRRLASDLPDASDPASVPAIASAPDKSGDALEGNDRVAGTGTSNQDQERP